MGSDSANPVNPPSLRGLSGSATLSLVNGHRLVSLGSVGTASDPTSIPLAAIERVEVLTDGASSTYGSDAVAGVINVILRKDLNGLDIQADYGLADGYAQRTISAVAGKTWSTGSFMIAGQYFSNSALMGYERSYVRDDLSAYPGGSDARTIYTDTPNVIADGQNFYWNGTSFVSGIARTDGSRNTSLIPAQHKWSAVANFRQDIGDSVHLFGDATFGSLKAVSLGNQSNGTFTITDANPFFQSPVAGATSEIVQYSLVRELGQYQANTNIVKYWSASGGADIDISSNWSAKAYVNYGHGYSKVDQPYGVNSDAFAAALASTDPDTAFDPFGNGTTQSTLDGILNAMNIPYAKHRLLQTVATINGSLFHLPGGDVKVAFGGEHRWEHYNGTLESGTTVDPDIINRVDQRNVNSLFGELLVPIFGEDNALPLLRKLTLNASVRYDHYSDFGGTTNPKFGIDWSPVDGLTLRGNYTRSFHAPSIADLNSTDSRAQYLPNINAPNFFTPVEVRDEGYNVLLLAGGNANLQPEKARAYSLGFDFAPAFAPRLKVSGTYFNIHYSNIVGLAGGAFTNPALTSRFVTFNPTQEQVDAAIAQEPALWGTVIPTADLDLIIDLRRSNLGVQNVSGLDYSVAYAIPTENAGRFNAGIDGTYYLTNESQPAPGSAFVNNIKDSIGYPRWYLRGTLGWQRNNLAANVFVNYTGPFNNVSVVPVQRVKANTTFDLHLAVDVAQGWHGSKLQLTFDVHNLFDKDPPLSYTSPGYLLNGASPIGRMGEIGARLQF
ncbi:TonB-dependent receptor domain-containing protein [Novosphingobium sp. 9]|uniref:TonB-dependent receptor domain-containing protein n=1 Tax=Novosphingobium sp. 9 TaxID=2025349 RepID=UPI0021B56B23|nr:TonB-dependent receptor [Novosphingobium sp. 9]